MAEENRRRHPHFRTEADEAEFWDRHSSMDFPGVEVHPETLRPLVDEPDTVHSLELEALMARNRGEQRGPLLRFLTVANRRAGTPAAALRRR